MITEKELREQLPFNLEKTDFPDLGTKYQGKVRDVYSKGDRMVLITTDRVSAFDRVLATIPFKGQILNQLAVFWFEKTKHIVKNHLIDVPDPNIMVGKKVGIIPIEVVVRGYLSGSAWRDYKDGKQVSGISLPQGMRMNERFKKPLFTPSTKAKVGHDVHISKEEILAQGTIDNKMMDKIERTAFALFDYGTQHCAKQGLILVDTKYEFGLLDNELYLADEIHTPDSSRFWYLDTYQHLFDAGKDQRMIDKEYLRQWLIRERNFIGDGPLPDIPDSIKIEFAQKYIQAYEEITGREFKASVGSIIGRIKKNLKERGYF